jgi:hypothetical protein
MVDYTHNWKTFSRIWDPKCKNVKAEAEVVFDEERYAHMLCQNGPNDIDIFVLPDDEKYVEVIDTWGEPLRG